jgi:hypothetical protein
MGAVSSRRAIAVADGIGGNSEFGVVVGLSVNSVWDKDVWLDSFRISVVVGRVAAPALAVRTPESPNSEIWEAVNPGVIITGRGEFAKSAVFVSATFVGGGTTHLGSATEGDVREFGLGVGRLFWANLATGVVGRGSGLAEKAVRNLLVGPNFLAAELVNEVLSVLAEVRD